MMKWILAPILMLISQLSWSDTAICRIEIQDVNSSTTYKVEQKFTFIDGGAPTRKQFDLPGSDYKCTLAFFDLKSGTMLSCEYKNDMGHTFFQSDRTILKEEQAANNLAFRHQSSFFVLKTKCESI